MNEQERFKEIAVTAGSCVEELRRLEKSCKDEGVRINISGVYYSLGYIEGLCNDRCDDNEEGE